MNIHEVLDAFEHQIEKREAGLRFNGAGMRVPENGDFVQCPPSTVGRLRWWLRELRAAAGPRPAEQLEFQWDE